MNWRHRAACREYDPELMSGNPDAMTAKRICASCPVRFQCLDWAVRNDEKWGVWGGLDRRERNRYVRVGIISTCPIHHVAYVAQCYACNPEHQDEEDDDAQEPGPKLKVGGRREQIAEWFAAGYHDSEIARMIAVEIGESVSPTTVTKARHRWGLVRHERHDMNEVHAVLNSRTGFSTLTRQEKVSLWMLWEKKGHSRKEFRQTFRTSWGTAKSLAEAAQRCLTTQSS